MVRRAAISHLAVVFGYVAIAVIFSWPLLLHLNTRLTGTPDGDTGVYVWNQWVFQHELLEHQRLPYFTHLIFSLGPAANLSVHNYTTFQDLVALPLSPLVGVVAAFNIVFILMSVLTAYSTFLLARHVTGRWGEAWLAGLLFAWCPLLVTRGMGHYSLVAAAPLAVFLLVLMKADGHERFRDAVALGAVVAWASYSDAYYGVYCLLIGATFLFARIFTIQNSPQAGRTTAVRWALDVLLLCGVALVAAIAVTGGQTLSLASLKISVRSLYTPMLVLTALAATRVLWRMRVAARSTARMDAYHLSLLTLAVGIVAAGLLSPVLYAASLGMANGGFAIPDVYWRSSPNGVDLAALVAPNPNHPLAPGWIRNWLSSLPNGFLENVASIPWVALAVIAVAWRMGWRSSRWWAALALAFGALSLGPFIHVAGVNTYIPGPWALLRYVPVVGLARSPTRFSVVMILAVAIVFATALEWIGRRYPERRRLLLGVIGVLLIVELLPAPLTLHSAEVPRFYRHLAAAPADVRALELPTGVSDGTSSVGKFSARYQFFQTAHGKSLIGGYLSRVSDGRVPSLRRNEMVDGLIILSEGKRLQPSQEASLIAAGPGFIRDAKVGFVIIDHDRASPALIQFATRAFRLQAVEGAGRLVLYRPDVHPATSAVESQ